MNHEPFQFPLSFLGARRDKGTASFGHINDPLCCIEFDGPFAVVGFDSRSSADLATDLSHNGLDYCFLIFSVLWNENKSKKAGLSSFHFNNLPIFYWIFLW